jgi:hypothetical protein
MEWGARLGMAQERRMLATAAKTYIRDFAVMAVRGKHKDKRNILKMKPFLLIPSDPVILFIAIDW